MRTYLFNNQQLTSAQIHALVPMYHVSTLLKHIREGRNTTEAILCYQPKRAKPTKLSQFVIGASSGFARNAPSRMR